MGENVKRKEQAGEQQSQKKNVGDNRGTVTWASVDAMAKSLCCAVDAMSSLGIGNASMLRLWFFGGWNHTIMTAISRGNTHTHTVP